MQLTKSLTLLSLFTSVMSHAAFGQQQSNGGYNLGDCVVGEQFSTCRSHLVQRGQSDGIDYLAETNCPNCVEGEEYVGDDGISTVRVYRCPSNEGWSAPNSENLDVLNSHYDIAEDDETGALVTGFDERVCWVGGTCMEGTCEQFITKMINFETGKRQRGWRCIKAGSRVFYIVKELGELCSNDMTDDMEATVNGPGGDMDGPPAE